MVSGGVEVSVLLKFAVIRQNFLDIRNEICSQSSSNRTKNEDTI